MRHPISVTQEDRVRQMTCMTVLLQAAAEHSI